MFSGLSSDIDEDGITDLDGGGIQDGTEMGLTMADVGLDTDLVVFIPDSEPTTTTNLPVAGDTEQRVQIPGKPLQFGFLGLLLVSFLHQ